MKTRVITAAFASLIVGGFAAGNVAIADDAANPGAAPAPVAQEPTVAQRVGQTVDDAALLTRIKTEMLRSDDVKGLDVNVDVKDGHVTLSGKTDSDAQRRAAEQIVKTTSGVKGIDNKLTLK